VRREKKDKEIDWETVVEEHTKITKWRTHFYKISHGSRL